MLLSLRHLIFALIYHVDAARSHIRSTVEPEVTTVLILKKFRHLVKSSRFLGNRRRHRPIGPGEKTASRLRGPIPFP